MKKVEPIKKRARWLRALITRLPRPRHLKGTWLHRQVGPKLFLPELWKPTRHGLAGGLAVGVFIALTPTIGIQMVLATIAAYLLRVNIPIAIAACWITNPATAPLIYPLQFQLGRWLVGIPDAEELGAFQGITRTYYLYAKPMFVGSLIPSLLGAGFAYGMAFLTWGLFERFLPRRRRLRPKPGRKNIPPTSTERPHS